MSTARTSPILRSPLLWGITAAIASWALLFAAFGPAAPRSPRFQWLGAGSFCAVTAVGIVAVLVGKTVWSYRFLFAGLASVMALWHHNTPSTTDGFSGVHTVTTVTASLICLSFVVAIDTIRDKINDKP